MTVSRGHVTVHVLKRPILSKECGAKSNICNQKGGKLQEMEPAARWEALWYVYFLQQICFELIQSWKMQWAEHKQMRNAYAVHNFSWKIGIKETTWKSKSRRKLNIKILSQRSPLYHLAIQSVGLLQITLLVRASVHSKSKSMNSSTESHCSQEVHNKEPVDVW